MLGDSHEKAQPLIQKPPLTLPALQQAVAVVARRLHAVEQAMSSADAHVRDEATREAGDIVRAAHVACERGGRMLG